MMLMPVVDQNRLDQTQRAGRGGGHSPPSLPLARRARGLVCFLFRFVDLVSSTRKPYHTQSGGSDLRQSGAGGAVHPGHRASFVHRHSPRARDPALARRERWAL